jgi:hypothetical protein
MASKQLSEQQLAILDWVRNGSGSLNIVARAGCGKTFTLVEVVRVLIELNARSIFFGVYNRDAAGDIRTRLEEAGIVGGRNQLRTSTMHAAGKGAWQYANPDCIVDDNKIETLIGRQWQPTVGGNNKETPHEVVSKFGDFIKELVSLAKQNGAGFLFELEDDSKWYDLVHHHSLEMKLTDDPDADVPQEDIRLGVEYSKLILKKSIEHDKIVIDCDDMIFAPLYHKVRFYKNEWVLVDEAQDTNPVRRALALALLAPGGRLIAVGDDRQAIYGFTGADANAMDLIQKSLNSKVLSLTMTFRCPKVVVKRANECVPDLEAHPSNSEGEERFIDYADLLKDAPDPERRPAVLCRKNAPLVMLAYSWLRRGIPCMIEGRDVTGGLVALMRKWKINLISALDNRLARYYEREIARAIAKGDNGLAERITEQRETMTALIEAARLAKLTTIEQLISMTYDMFGDTRDGKVDRDMIVLSSIHKSKGREWKDVFILGANLWQPSPWARQDWEQLQESNLVYVSVTRSMETLTHVKCPPPPPPNRNAGGGW